MVYIVICLVLYTALVFLDVVPAFKKKQWKALYFSIPVYIITLIMNIIIGLGARISGPNQLIEKLFSSFVK